MTGHITVNLGNFIMDCVGARRLKIQPDKSFVEIFKKTAYVFQNEKVFLSEKIFEELCKESEKKDGQIQIRNFSESKFIYQISFCDFNNKKEKEEINILIGINASKYAKKRFQLLSFSSSEAKYTNTAPKMSCGFYLDKQNILKNKHEICQ